MVKLGRGVWGLGADSGVVKRFADVGVSEGCVDVENARGWGGF